jgi:hypothetical protein
MKRADDAHVLYRTDFGRFGSTSRRDFSTPMAFHHPGALLLTSGVRNQPILGPATVIQPLNLA